MNEEKDVTTIVISCVEKKENGTILNVGIETLDNNDEETVLIVTKEELITHIRKHMKGNIVIITKDGTEVHIVNKDQYLRTDGDHNKDNDLVDLPNCSK